MKKMNFSVTILMNMVEFEDIRIEMTDIPMIPRKGDMIDISSFLELEEITDEQYDKIHSLDWEAESIYWTKNHDSYDVTIFCEPIIPERSM